MRNKTLLTIIFGLSLLLAGCGGSPNGASWASADFNKYDQNYQRFNTSGLEVGDTKNEVLANLNIAYEVIEAGKGYQVLAFQRWVSVPGPDYVGNTLYIRLENERLANWKVTSDTISVAPRSW